MGGGRPKVKAPEPGPYEKRLAKEMEMLWPYKEALLRSYAWALPGAPAGGAPAAPVAPVASGSPTTPPVDLEGEYVKYHGAVLPAEEYRAFWQEIQQLPPWELLRRMQEWERRREETPEVDISLIPGERLKYELLKQAYEAKTKGYTAPSAPSVPSAPATSPTRPPTYMLAPYIEAIEKEYGRAKEAIAGMRPGGAKEKAMLELEAYWKPHAKASAIRALYEEARAGIAALVGEYTPTLRTLAGLEQQRAAMVFQQKAAAAQAAAAQQASMWQSLGGLASLGMMALFF